MSTFKPGDFVRAIADVSSDGIRLAKGAVYRIVDIETGKIKLEDGNTYWMPHHFESVVDKETTTPTFQVGDWVRTIEGNSQIKPGVYEVEAVMLGERFADGKTRLRLRNAGNIYAHRCIATEPPVPPKPSEHYLVNALYGLF